MSWCFVQKVTRKVCWDNLFQGRKPCRIVVCFVEETGFSGSYTSNPFNFQNCGVTSMCLYCDGIPVNGAPWKLNFKTKSVVRAYSDIFQFVNKAKEKFGNNISLNDFVRGTSLFTFHMEPFYDGKTST